MADDWISTFFDESPSSPKKEPDPPLSSNSTKKISLSTGNPELDERLKIFEKSHDDLKKQIDDIFLQSGMTQKTITDYLNNPNNFSSTQWALIQQQREQLQEKIWKMVGKKYKQIFTAKQQAKSSKERKGKTLGARKNWMPMH